MTQQNPNHPLMTIQEASEALRLSRNTLNNWLSIGRLKRVKIGARTFLSREEIEGILKDALQEERSAHIPPAVKEALRPRFNTV